MFPKINACYFLLLLLACNGKTSLNKEQSFRPNILWISVEDISPYLPQYGDSTITTPHIDRIARGGVVYTNAFTCSGVCAPSRSSIITGMYPQALGTMHMRTASDYHCSGSEYYEKDYGLRDPSGQNVPRYSAVIPPEVKVFTEYLRQAGYFCANNPKTDYQFATPMTAWDECGQDAHWSHRQAGEPFFYVRNLMVTHESRIWMKQGDSLLVDPAEVPVPPYYPDSPVIRRDVARNYSNIKEMDGQVGEILDALEADGLLDSTIIFFWSDHGGPLPRGKREVYDSGIHVPLIINVPAKWQRRVFGRVLDGDQIHFDDRMVSLIDLAPSMLSILGIDIPQHMQGKAFLGPAKAGPRRYIFAGRDRLDTHYDRVRVVRDKDYLFVKNYHPEISPYVPIAYRQNNMDMMKELLRLKDSGELQGAPALWFRPSKPPEEFYVVEEDPFQLDNRIEEPGLQEAVARLRAALDNWEAGLNDRSALPESEMVAQMWPGFEQPVTEMPVIEIKDGKIYLSCATLGASIAYHFSEKEEPAEEWDAWELYHHPIAVPETGFLYARAVRIGYKPSGLVSRGL